MKSPFPGMDPYIESGTFWSDFYTDLMAEIKRAIASVLPRQYRVRMEQREVIELVEEDGKTDRSMYADVSVTTALSTPAAVQVSVAVAEPATGTEPMSMRAFVAEDFREQFIEITSVEPDRRLVTCIELLSPSNKRARSASREQYLRKRQALLLGESNLVEIDLLRGGTRMPMLDPWPDSPYRLLVGRWYKEGVCQVWRGHHRERLPVIPIPLERPDPDIPLDLQPMIEAIYQRSRYGDDIDYTKPLTPPLAETEQAWLLKQLETRQAGNAPGGASLSS